jgi:hypothetical protein
MARLFALTERFEEAILIYEELGRWLPLSYMEKIMYF